MKKIILLFTLTLLLTSCNFFGTQNQKEENTHTTTTKQESLEKSIKENTEEKLETNSDRKPDFSKNSVFTSLDTEQQGSNFIVSGAVTGTVERVEIVWENGEKKDSYFLKKFKKGDKKWLTNLQQQYGNFALGDNKYTVKGYVGEKVIEEASFTVPFTDCIINYKTLTGDVYMMNFGNADNCNNGKLNVISKPVYGEGLSDEQQFENRERATKEGLDPNSHVFPNYIVIDNFTVEINKFAYQIGKDITTKEINPLLTAKLKEAYEPFEGFNLFSEEDYAKLTATKKYFTTYYYNLEFISKNGGEEYLEIYFKTKDKEEAQKLFEKFNEIFTNMKVNYQSKKRVESEPDFLGQDYSKNIQNDIIEKQESVNNSELDISEATLLKAGYKKNKLGDITEYYASFDLDVNNGYYRNQTIYKQGDKSLNFGIIYAHGPALKIELPGKNVTIHLDELDFLQDEELYKEQFGYNIGQPILGNYDYKVIITDLDTIKIVNKAKGINKVIWKR